MSHGSGRHDETTAGNVDDPPSDEEPAQGIVNGAGVDLSAGYGGTSAGGSGGDRGSGGRAGTGQALTEICAHPVGRLTSEQEWTLCGSGDFPVISRHPEWPPTIAAPTTPCPNCSPSTIVRVSDLENFPAPAAPSGMEPNGWAVVGLAANFWAGASAQVGEGLLLGQPAQVMFTPIGYRWNYGDGTAGSSVTGGASWEDLGVAEFASTATSHVYTTKGTYSVVLTVEYRADYSFGDQGWRPVEGIVTVPSAPFAVVAANESTVLVAEDCNVNPHGPGC
ncbi:PKD domain-containing protein [Cryobacterium serini]|uniref:PKD domain-containing protein n=1 Tax=Cryobacterium serini TaxID=1259201 RepID=A0A4R9BI41_9MICO|nr:PKD domain-containing protein [Cryobacterium serini]TFD84932.1 hypothetical protein E3T51_16460 [Cryobacterium serini]